MGLTIAQKIIKNHLVAGEMTVGSEISLKIDQTLTQDATGTMAYLQLEALGIDKVKTEKSVAYIDHNTLQSGFENADDHNYIGSVAKKYGIYFSKAGNGICHQVHLERFGSPGKTLIGSDSHTPTCGGIGQLSFGAGGLDVAAAMAGAAYNIPMPKIVKIELVNTLADFVTAKDIILEVLRILSVKGGVGRIIEYVGAGAEALSVPERATITNMGAELGATTSIFGSDEKTRLFLKSQNREQDYTELSADADAVYDEEYTIDLAKLTPLTAMPHMPDNIKPISEIAGIKVDQCCIGSCTNSSYFDLMKVAGILKGKKVAEGVSLTISPGSMQVFNALAKNGALADIISSGARILECTCGPCIGMGQSPNSKGISLRTFNRNFEGRSGTQDASIYLVSPETAAVSAVTGVLTDPRDFGECPKIEIPNEFEINDCMIVEPAKDGSNVEIIRGPNIKPFPTASALADKIECKTILKTDDNITTDHILPAGSALLPYRSNIPHYSNYCFVNVDKDFAKRAKENNGGIIVGGSNYGQGSSREHAALVPLYLGVKAVLVKSFARIHKANLINSGIIPLEFKNPDDYNEISLMDDLVLPNILDEIKTGSEVTVINATTKKEIKAVFALSEREKNAIMYGGTLNYIRENLK